MAPSFPGISCCILLSVTLTIIYTNSAEGVSSHISKFNTLPLTISSDKNNYSLANFRHDDVQYLNKHRIKEEALMMLIETALQLFENSILINTSKAGSSAYVMKPNKTDESTQRSGSTIEYIHQLLSFVKNPVISVHLSKESETGRLIFFKGNNNVDMYTLILKKYIKKVKLKAKLKIVQPN